MDVMISDKTTVPWSPPKVLVGVLRAAMLANSPFAVRYVLNYARAKLTEKDLRGAANCLGGECNCPAERVWSPFRVCCAWRGSHINHLPFTILESFFMARTKVTELMVEFVESLGIKIGEKLWPHLAQQKDDDVNPLERLLRAASRGDEEEVRLLLAEGVDPDDGRDADMFGRTPLMYAIYHKKPSMVEALLQAGANTETEIYDINALSMVAIANATELIDILCVDKDGKFSSKSAPWLLEVARQCNNVGVFRAVVSRCEDQLLESRFSGLVQRPHYWHAGSCFSFEIAETMLPHLLSAFGKCSRKYTRTVQALLISDYPNVLRVFLSHESFYKNTEKNWYVLLGGKDRDYHAYPSTACVRLLLGEGLCINPRDDTLPSPTVLHDAVEINCTGLVKLYLRAGADRTLLAYRDFPRSQGTLTPAQYARKKGQDECAELIEQFFPTLTQLCLWTVRLHLHKPMSKYVDSLCVPIELKCEIVLPWIPNAFGLRPAARHYRRI